MLFVLKFKKRLIASLPFGLFDQLSSMKDPVGHGPFQQIPIVTIFLQRSGLYPSTKMTSCTQINSGWFRRHNVDGTLLANHKMAWTILSVLLG